MAAKNGFNHLHHHSRHHQKFKCDEMSTSHVSVFHFSHSEKLQNCQELAIKRKIVKFYAELSVRTFSVKIGWGRLLCTIQTYDVIV